MYADQAQASEWRPDDSGETSERSRRVLSIEELRKRLGVAAPAEQPARAKRPEASEEMSVRPRIVRRGVEAQAS